MKEKLLLLSLLLSGISAGASAQLTPSLQKVKMTATARTAQMPAASETELSLFEKDSTMFITGQLGQSVKLRLSVKFPKEYLSEIAGNKITKVNYAVANGISNLKVFISNTLDPTVTPLVEKNGLNTSGLHELALDEPLEIKGDEDLYIGYECNNTGNQYAIPLGHGNSENNNVLYYYQKNWYQIGWSDELGALPFAVQMTGDKKITKTDIRVKSLIMPDLIEQGDKLQAQVLIQNNGFIPAPKTNLSFGLQSSNINEQVVDVLPRGNQNYTINVDYADVENGKIGYDTFQFSAVPTETTDLDEDNNHKSYALNITNGHKGITDATKKILVEQFTTNLCPNCPRGHQTVKSAIADYKDDVILLAQHSGYYSDNFTLDYQNELATYLFNMGGNAFAPAVMIDRIYKEENASGMNPNGSGGAPFVPEEARMKKLLQESKEAPIYASLNMTVKPDTGNEKAEVTITGKSLLRLNAPSINLVVTEDGIKSDQSGASGVWTNDHTARICPTGANGEIVKLDEEGNFTYTTTVEYVTTIKGSTGVPTKTSYKDWDFIAFFASGNVYENPTSANVYNAVKVEKPLRGVGISSTEGENELAIYAEGNELHIEGEFDHAQIYNTNGSLAKTINAGQSETSLSDIAVRGIYLVKVVAGDTTKVEKIIIGE